MTRRTRRDETTRAKGMARVVLIALAITVWYMVLSTSLGIANGLTGPDEFPGTETETTTETRPETETVDVSLAPKCWEDEVIVLVVWDPYGDLDETQTLGCVPSDNLPVNGFRP